MSRWRIVLAGTAVAVAFAACSSGDNSAPNTATAPTTVATTTVADPTTAVSSTTTALPTTTLDPAITLAAEVEADFREAYDLAKQASQDPFNSELEQAALDRRLGAAGEMLAAKLATFREKNYAIRLSDTTPPSVTIEIAARLIPPSDDVVELQVCEIDSWVKVEVGAGPNGTDAIVNPDVVAYRSQIFMRNIDGIWKLEGSKDLQTWEGVTSCPG